MQLASQEARRQFSQESLEQSSDSVWVSDVRRKQIDISLCLRGINNVQRDT